LQSKVRSVWILLLLTVASGLALADDPQEASEGIRVVSWNISDDSFVSHRLAFQALLLRANPDADRSEILPDPISNLTRA